MRKNDKECPEKVKLYEHFANCGIMHLPGVCFPAIAIQVDTLSSILSTGIVILKKGKKEKNKGLYVSALDFAKYLRG